MKYVQIVISYLKGAGSHLGTTKNLLREVVVAVITALATGLAIHFFMPKEDSPISDFKDILVTTLAAQHEADSLRYENRRAIDRRAIDSLQHEIILAYERDSLLLNAHLSTLDAMRQINSAIGSPKK